MNNPFEFTAYKGKRKVPTPVDLPPLDGAPLVDTHAHLDMLDDPALALARAAYVGLTHIMTITDLYDDNLRVYRESDQWLEQAQKLLDAATPDRLPAGVAPPRCQTPPRIGIIVGMHPHNARHYTPDVADRIRELAADPRTVGLGEAGLDYHYDHSPREVQRTVFAQQLELARELHLPVTIHLREAHDDGLAILKAASPLSRTPILHCFNLEPQVAEPFLALGCVVSFAGPVTFKRADEVRAAAASAPQGRVMVETDAPFMAPEPFRGQPCEPAHTLYNAAAVAAARGISLPQLAAETTACAAEVFGW